MSSAPEPVDPAAIPAAPRATEADASAAAADSEGGVGPRRIPIGTQRPGVKPPRLAPRYEYFSSGSPAPVTAAGLSAGSAPAAGDPPHTAAHATNAPAVPEAASATAAPAAGQPVGGPAGGTPRPNASAAGQRRPGRRDGRGAAEKSPFADVQRPGKTVAVPNLRSALDDELEQDFEAALAGVSIDDLIEATAPARADAPLEPGTRLSGTVLSIGPDTVFFDLGDRRQGAMKLAGLEPDEMPEVGASVDLNVGGRNEEDGLYDVAFANRAVAVEDWSQLQAGMIVEARVTGANKGGLECEVAGLRGFMPASLVSTWRIEKLEEMVGQTLESLVTDIVPAARRLVLSRRAVIEKQAAEARAKLLETLEPGTMLDGIVRSVRDFGAFVDVGNGVDGLVHVSQMSWDRVKNPGDVLEVGQKVRVAVKNVDRQTGKIGLSIRDTVESPWKNAAEKYHVGAGVRGVVSRIAQFGAFVRLEPGVEGLVHVSELAHRHVHSVSSVVREGEAVECKVLACDPDEQRIALSIKALATPPAQAAGAEDAPEPEVEEPAPPPVKKSNAPLTGGLTGRSDGAKFGLKW
ncbi:MAG: S1 RNA-binding domain-containing protein [Planctomycetia bacterium]